MSSFIKKNKKTTTSSILDAFQSENQADQQKNDKKKKGGKNSAAVVESRDAEENDDAPLTLVATPEDALIKEMIDKHVNDMIVQDGLRALIKFERQQQETSTKGATKANLFDEKLVKSILLQVITLFFCLFSLAKCLYFTLDGVYSLQHHLPKCETDPSEDSSFFLSFTSRFL
jgi:hypothetical protein